MRVIPHGINYANFEVPYYGTDNDDYVNGEGFCCDDAKRLKSFDPSKNDNPELFQYYYHSDHLGSSSLITNLDGEVIQHVEYVPFGEVFIEERNNTWNTPYLFNAKELDPETSLYYYGARYYDPRTSVWLSTDPLQEKYLSVSTYVYCVQNPILYIDPTGMDNYRYDDKTGEFILMEQNKDKFDQVLGYHYDKKAGEWQKNTKWYQTKTRISDIEKGILSNGINFKEKDNVIAVGGKGQASVEGVKSFTLKLAELVGKEIKGYSYSSNTKGNVTDIVLGKYINNTLKSSRGSTNALSKKYGNNFSFNNVLQEFHTHPNGELGATQSAPNLSQDVITLQHDKPKIPNASFIILYRIAGQEQPEEYDYTHEYRP